MIYVVSYDLSRGLFGRSPQPFYDELEICRSWWHYLEKTWLISTTETMEQLHQRLSQYLTRTDSILITELTQHYRGALPAEAWEWIEERISGGELDD